ncbi:3'-5' exoribonuclease [Bacillus sp. BRMEA1]|uniref:exonuclease domain-containing protein n=1 Tax=Neobacillus endophyticus TaxID=2738405 RepID=UPI0015630B6A|nr:exonuclease domain-containing protein [Neobacillus endophyticus]NRD77971.1 3'-5' exoribonuclease [Neobacillus endophyticus]
MGINEISQFFRQISGMVTSNIYAGLQVPSTPKEMAFLRALQKEVKENNGLDIPLNKLNVVVFDIETTGFNPEKGDQIISIGAVKMTGHHLLEQGTFYSLLKSDLEIPNEISELTNIWTEDLQTAPPAKDVLLQFFKYVSSDLLVAHHSKHEQSFMQKITKELLRVKFERRIVDTSFLIRISKPAQKSWSLEEICRESGIEVKNRHHALGDALLTAQVWSLFLQEAVEKGFKTLRDIYEHLAKSE